MSDPHPLIEALKKAAADPGSRQAFYELLLKSTIFAPAMEESGTEGVSAQVRFKQWEQPQGFLAIPFFAALEDLRQTLGPEEPHLSLPALDFFRMTRGATVALVTLDSGAKTFQPPEVEALLSASLAAAASTDLGQEDSLAQALEKAAREDGDQAKNAFYSLLINARVYVFGQPRSAESAPGSAGLPDVSPEDKFILATAAHPHLAGQRIIPFFSSVELLRRSVQGADPANPAGQSFLGFGALTLFKLAQNMGLPLILNPGPRVYKIFSLEEVGFILEHARPEPFERRQFQTGTKIFLGPPEVQPRDLTEDLRRFFSGQPEVRSAYLTTLRESSEKAAPALVIGLETEAGADLTGILRLAGPVAARHARPGQAIDFAQVVPGEKGLSQFFLERVQPFHRRSPGGEEGPPDRPPDLAGGWAQYETSGFFGRLKRIFKG